MISSPPQQQQQQHHEIYSSPKSAVDSRNGSISTDPYMRTNNDHLNDHRQYDYYDVQAFESPLPRPEIPKNPIPSPAVTIRSEFPTLTRSRQQQTLTCLVTVEVPEGVWQPQLPDHQLGTIQARTSDHIHDENLSPATRRFPPSPIPRSIQLEPQEKLDEVAEHLRMRLESWHGLEVKWYACFFFSSLSPTTTTS